MALPTSRSSGRSATGGEAFYSIFNFGTENLAPIRVVWATMGTRFRAAVVADFRDPLLGAKPPQVKNTVIFAPVATAEEGHYLCALLNSTPLNYLATFSSVRGGKSFGSGGFFARVRIDRFDARNSVHVALAASSHRAHLAAATGDTVTLNSVAAEVDANAAKYWGLSHGELQDMDMMLALLGIPKAGAEEPIGEPEEAAGNEPAVV